MARRKATPSGNSLSRIATRPEQAEQLLQAGLGSAFAIARGSVEALMKRTPGLSGEDARRLHQRASALAVLAAREYREERLTTEDSGDQPWRTGLRALVEGPTFESQFSPSWSDNCLPGSIEATTSPAAYLTALFTWVTRVIEPLANTEEATPILLAERRPDLAALLLDNQALERVEPTIGIVNEILEGAARRHLDELNQKTLAVDDALLEARYPLGLPFERYMSQINNILQPKNYGLGDLVRQLDPEFPYFCRLGLHSLRSDDALQMDTALGPEQRALLLEAAYFPRGARRASARTVQTLTNPRTLLRESLHTLQNAFFMRHYGVEKAEDLLPLSAFCLRTGLNQDGIESLLSIQRYAPVASPNVPGLTVPGPARFGSVYINSGIEPAIGVSTVDKQHRLSDWSNDHFDRMQRMIRLARWLELPFGETDQLLDAALQAEYGEAGRGREITENTLRALGLFRRLRRDFKVQAEEFAALLQGVALYARGSEIPQFDRVFNDPTLFSEPLVLDGRPFNIAPGNEVEYRRIHHLCAALGIDYETYLYLARYIVQTGDQQALLAKGQAEVLHWSHSVISAFYRLARLPALLGLTSIEALALLQLIGERGHQYVSRLVNTTLAIHQHSDLSDTLSVVQSMADAVQWCREHDLSVSWLYQHLMPLAPPAAASGVELDLLRQMHGRMLPTLLSNMVFSDAGLPMISGKDEPTPIDWMTLLQVFVSKEGLIVELAEHPNIEDYEAALKSRLELIVDNLELEDGPHIVIRVFQLVMDARSAQHALVWESLASSFGGSAELSQEVLAWAGGSSYQLLGEVHELFVEEDPLPVPIGDDILELLARLGHRMGIVEQLGLSPLALRSWRLHPEWFEGEMGGDGGTITFANLHLLTQYHYLLAFTKQAEQVLLDYLKLVNNLPPDLTEQDLQLIREDAAGKIAQFTGFGVRDILETAAEITDNGLIVTVRQLDHLVRVRQACTKLQLGSAAAVALSRLRSNSLREEYRAAAESALSSLVEQQRGQSTAQGELGQSEASWIVVDVLRLVAKAGGRAICLLTVKNFAGEPLPGITVTWETDHSRLGGPSSFTTDENGQVENYLLAGEEMGTAQITARFGLDRQILAPLILIDCDETSLTIKDPVCAPMEALAGNLALIEYGLRLEDDFGNPGRDRVLEWSTDLGTFERPQTRTDAKGLASARLRSLSSGEAVVVVRLPLNGEAHTYEAVEFLEQQYFQYVRFNGPVAATQPVTVTCRAVNLDGSPQDKLTAHWDADVGSFSADRSITDAQGIASIEYTADEPGEVTVTVKATFNDKPLQPLSSERTTIHELPRLVEMEPAEQFYIVGQFLAATFRVRLEPAAAELPVTWWKGDELLATTKTTAEGVTGYQAHFNDNEVGTHTITVKSVRAGDEFNFKVRVVAQHAELVAQVGSNSPGMVPVDAVKGAYCIDPGLSSSLLVRAVRNDGEGDSQGRMTFSLGEGANPASLGVTFSPPLGQLLDCAEDGGVTLQIDCSKAAFLADSDPYSNDIVLNVKSNLGVTLALKFSLRYLLDLEKSELHFFRGPLDGKDHAALGGRLARRNGAAPMTLREGQTRVQLFLAGASSQVADLTSYGQGDVWLPCTSFTGDLGAIESKCRFNRTGDLSRRVHFVGSDTFEAKRIISEATLTLLPATDSGIVGSGNTFVADQGDTSRLVLTLSDAGGGISGLPLLPGKKQVQSVEFRGGGPTDANGQTWLDVDARNALIEGQYPLLISLGHLSRTLDLLVRELIATDVEMTREAETLIRINVHYARRKGFVFTEDGQSYLFELHIDDTMRNLRATPEAHGFTLGTLANTSENLLRLALGHLTDRRFCLYGPTEFPIVADSASGVES